MTTGATGSYAAKTENNVLLNLSGDNSIVGRSVAVYADGSTTPIACCIVGYEKNPNGTTYYPSYGHSNYGHGYHGYGHGGYGHGHGHSYGNQYAKGGYGYGSRTANHGHKHGSDYATYSHGKGYGYNSGYKSHGYY